MSSLSSKTEVSLVQDLGAHPGVDFRQATGIGISGLTMSVSDRVRGSAGGSFYIFMGLCAALVIVAGFAPSLVDTAGRKAPASALVALHGLASVAWLFTFLTQASLAARGRLALHRRIGIASMLLAVIMVLSGYFVAITMAGRGYDLSGDLHIESDPALGLINPLGDIAAYGLLVAAAYWFRRRADVHKRLMVLAISSLMPAPLAHLIGHSQVLNSLPPPIILLPIAFFFFASAVRDRISFGRVHPVSLWVALLLFAWQIAMNGFIGPSAAWHQVAHRLIS